MAITSSNFYQAVIGALQQGTPYTAPPEINMNLFGVVTSASPSSVKLYDLTTKSRMTHTGMPATNSHFEYAGSFNHDGSLYAVGHQVYNGTGYTVYNTSDWSKLTSLPAVAYNCGNCRFSPDGQFLILTFTTAPRFRVINTTTWTVVAGTPTIPSSPICSAFNPSGTMLVLGHALSSSRCITAIDTINWTTITTPTYSGGQAEDLSFSPDGSTLFVGITGNINYVRIFNTSTWAQQTTPAITMESGGGIETVAYSPYQSTIYVAARRTIPFRVDKLLVYNTSDLSIRYDTPALKRFITTPTTFNNGYLFSNTERSIIVYDSNNECVVEFLPPTGSGIFRWVAHSPVAYNLIFDSMLHTLTDQVVSPTPTNVITDAATGNALFARPTRRANVGNLPSTVYSAWASDIGVSDVDSLPHNLTFGSYTTASCSVLSLNFAYQQTGTSNIILVSGTGCIGVIHNHLDENTFDVTWSSGGAWDLEYYGDVSINQDDYLAFVSNDLYNGVPSCRLNVCSGHLQHSITSFKWQQSSTVAILHVVYTDQSSAQTVEAAYRFELGGKIDIVFNCTSFQRTKFNISTFDEIQYGMFATKNNGGMCDNITEFGVTHHYSNY